MRLRGTFTTDETGIGFISFPNVTGYLESIQFIDPASGGVGNACNMGLFLVTDYVALSDFPLWFNTAVGANALVLPRQLTQKNIDGADTTFYERYYLSDDTLLLSIDDQADNPAGGKTGTIILRVSQPDPVRR